MAPIRSKIDFDDERFLMFELDKLAYLKEEQGEEVIRMTLGKSELPVHDAITDAIVDAARDYAKYTRVFPGGLPELREALAAHVNERFGTAYDSENIVIGCGTSSIFRNLFQILCAAGDEVLLPMPYYPLYRFSAKLAGASCRYYDIGLDDMRVDFDSFRENFTDETRVVVFNTPGNPLGNVLTEDDIRTLDEIVDGRAVLINDAIYENMYFDEPPKTLLEIDGLRSPFVVTNAFSKGYRMYARRVGWCIVPDELVTPLTVIQHHTLLTVDPIPQYGALAALEHEEEVVALTRIYKNRRDYALKVFDGSGEVRALPSQGSFYLTLDCSQYMKRRGITSGFALAKEIIEQQNVATVPGSDFGIPLTQRLSFSTPRWQEGIDRLADHFERR
jgi:aspartate/methionine/tyrosine aminotransferase